MLKLMKYEFRKLRTALIALVGVLAALEIGFLIGMNHEKADWTGICLGLITMLVFAVYGFILLAGIVSYSRELKEKSGYLIFLTPVRPIGVVLSKLLFTALAALAATAVFGLTAYLDFRMLFDRLDVDPQVLDQINMVLRFGLNANAGIEQILMRAAFFTGTVLIEVLLTMCTAYLAITLSATLLQNKKGFLRGLISLALFIGLSWGCGKLTQWLLYDRVRGASITLSQLIGALGWSALLNAALCAVFAGASAWLLDRKVNL